MAECTAVAKSTGEVCGQPALNSSDPDRPRCLFHADDPATVALREAGRRQGGQRNSLRLPKEAPHNLTEIRANVAELIVQMQSLPASAANVRAILDAYTLSAKLFEMDELEKRIAALEAGS